MTQPQQLGFGFDRMLEEQETAHLPSGIEQGIAHYRGMLEKHNAAMLGGDEKAAMDIRKEANRLAVKLNDGAPAFLAVPTRRVMSSWTAPPPRPETFRCGARKANSTSRSAICQFI